MILRLLQRCGWHGADDFVDFIACGISVLPVLLILNGFLEAAAVVMLILINALVFFGVRANAMQNLEQEQKSIRDKARRQGRDGKD